MKPHPFTPGAGHRWRWCAVCDRTISSHPDPTPAPTDRDLMVDLAAAIDELDASTSPTAPQVANRLRTHLTHLEETTTCETSADSS